MRDPLLLGSISGAADVWKLTSERKFSFVCGEFQKHTKACDY